MDIVTARIKCGSRSGNATLEGNETMAEHKHGEMDITVQEETFAGFVSFTIKTVCVILVAVIILSLVGA